MFIYEPKVTLIGKPAFVEPDHLRVNWKGDSGDGERLVEYAGRLCYLSQANPAKRTTQEYIGNIIQQMHGSVLEHAVYVLLIEGISRSCSHELVRHRAGWGYSQLSQRYVDESEAQFVVPPALLEENESLQVWKDQVSQALTAYGVLVKQLMTKYEHVEDKTLRRKMAREAARSVLPNATETKIVASGNVRAWRTMLELRMSPHADQEIRRMAFKCFESLRDVAPAFFEDFIFSVDSGVVSAQPVHHKV